MPNLFQQIFPSLMQLEIQKMAQANDPMRALQMQNIQDQMDQRKWTRTQAEDVIKRDTTAREGLAQNIMLQGIQQAEPLINMMGPPTPEEFATNTTPYDRVSELLNNVQQRAKLVRSGGAELATDIGGTRYGQQLMGMTPTPASSEGGAFAQQNEFVTNFEARLADGYQPQPWEQEQYRRAKAFVNRNAFVNFMLESQTGDRKIQSYYKYDPSDNSFELVTQGVKQPAQMSPVFKAFLEKELFTSVQMVNELGGLLEQVKPKDLSIPQKVVNKVVGLWTRIADPDFDPKNYKGFLKELVQNAPESGAIRREMEQHFFRRFRKPITGAQAAMVEINVLRNTYVHSDMTYYEYVAGVAGIIQRELGAIPEYENSLRTGEYPKLRFTKDMFDNFMKNLGVDPTASPEQQTNKAGLLEQFGLGQTPTVTEKPSTPPPQGVNEMGGHVWTEIRPNVFDWVPKGQ